MRRPSPTTLALAFGAGGPPVGGRRHQTPTQRRPGHRPPGDRATATGIGGRRLSFQLRLPLIEQPMEGVWLEGPRPLPAIFTLAAEGSRGAWGDRSPLDPARPP